MKVILLQHLSGAKSYEAGQEIEVSEQEALRFIKKGIAEAKTKKAHNELMDNAEKLEKEEADKRAKIIAIQKGKELRGEANALLDELVAIVATLESIDPNYRDEFIGMFQEKFVPVENDKGEVK